MYEHSASRGPSAVAELLVYFGALSDISGTAEARVVKFYTQIDYIISQLTDKKPPYKMLGQRHLTYFQFRRPNHIFVNATTRVAKFCRYM